MKTLLMLSFASILFICTVPASGAPQEREMRSYVTGVGSGVDVDRGTADDQAYQQAQQNANVYCSMGMIENNDYEKTADSCATQHDGDNVTYLCMVTVKAVCVVHY